MDPLIQRKIPEAHHPAYLPFLPPPNFSFKNKKLQVHPKIQMKTSRSQTRFGEKKIRISSLLTVNNKESVGQAYGPREWN